MEKTPYIEKISIESLWGLYDVDWSLHQDVNILLGENGSGKSTILQIIELLLSNNSKQILDKSIKVKAVKFIFSNKKIINDTIKLVYSEGKYFSTKNQEEPIDVLPIELIDTFGAPIKHFSEYDSLEKTHINSILKEKINEYTQYQLLQYKKAASGELSLEKSLEKTRYFKNTINRLFEHTNKTFQDDKNFYFELPSGLGILPQMLSAGEKQLLIILLTVLCQQEERCVLLLDEPEISLHIRWQYELIEIIRTLNPNCQLIIATHSSSVFTKGWRDKIFDMLPGEHGRKPIMSLSKTSKNDI